MVPRYYLFDHTPDSLAAALGELGLPRFRAGQILEWVYQRGITDPQAMTNLSRADRQLITEHLAFTACSVVREQQATDGVRKLLVEWHRMPAMDDAGSDVSNTDVATTTLPVLGRTDRQTECVMIPTEDRRTACISSQVGCAVGCRFCASGLGGLDGNLSAGQIVEQVYRLGQLPGADRISNVVFMGMGEPLSNFEAVTRAIETLNADWGLGISARKITVSTVGLPAQMRRLADWGMPVTLAISLHAPNDDIRRELIPWARFVSIPQLLDAGRCYFEKTGREITLEYILLHHVNDQPEHARELVRLARQLRSNVNLIRYNEVSDLAFERPTDDDVHRFQNILRNAGVNTHIRASRGRDIAAACGQLRHENSLA